MFKSIRETVVTTKDLQHKQLESHTFKICVSLIAFVLLILFSNPAYGQIINPGLNSTNQPGSLVPPTSWTVSTIPYGSGGLSAFHHSSPYGFMMDLSNSGSDRSITLQQADVNFTGFSDLEFWCCSSTIQYWNYTNGNLLSVLVDDVSIFNVSGVYDISGVAWFSSTVDVSGYSGLHNLKITMTKNPSILDYGVYYLDDISLKSIPDVPKTANIWSMGSAFEYGASNRFYADFDTQENKNYTVDVYAVNATNYTLIKTENVFNQTTWMAYPVDFIAPVSTLDYDSIYGVVRDSDLQFMNVTVPLVTDRDNYFKFIPGVIGLNQSTTLYYNYDYRSIYFTDFLIKMDYSFQPGNKWGDNWNIEHVIGLDNYSSGEHVESGNTYSLMQPCVIGFGLYHGDTKLMSDTFNVINGSSLPLVPSYNDTVYPGQNNNTSLPDIPAPYYPPSPYYPDSDPDPEDNNSTEYNDSSGEWEYENSTPDGSGGFFPDNVPGNTSVDSSGYQGYYDSVDGLFSPLNNSIQGFGNFLLYPVRTLTDSVSSLNDSFTSSRVGLYNESFLTDVVRICVFSMPTKIQFLISYSLILSLILLVLKGRK